MSQAPTSAVLRVGIVTVSDRSARGDRPDVSGPALAGQVQALGWQVTRRALLPDEQPQVQALLTEWADSGQFDLVLTTGGTGFSPRDVTPEATAAVIERPAPGLAEAMRAAGLAVTPHAMLGRGLAGIRARTLLVNLPGSPQAALENLAVITPALPHAVQLLRQDAAAEAGHRQVGN